MSLFCLVGVQFVVSVLISLLSLDAVILCSMDVYLSYILGSWMGEWDLACVGPRL